MRQYRFTFHLHSASRTYYIFDALAGEPCVKGIVSEAEAAAETRRRQHAFNQQCQQWERRELGFA